jgi:hypothetical protein
MKRSRIAGSISSTRDAAPDDAAPCAISGNVGHPEAQETAGVTSNDPAASTIRPAAARTRGPLPRYVAQHLAN